MKSGCSSLAGACKQLLLYHWMDQTRLTSLKACQLHLGSVDRRNSEQGGQPFRLCTSTLLWISSYLRSISWISVDKPSLSSFQASKQAGKGTEIKRVQPGGTCMALQPHSRRRLIFELDLRHVKSHLWLFVNCPLAELCKAHWEGPLGRPTGKAHGKAHYSHEEVTKAWSKNPAFGSQTKEQMTLKVSHVSFAVTLCHVAIPCESVWRPSGCQPQQKLWQQEACKERTLDSEFVRKHQVSDGTFPPK